MQQQVTLADGVQNRAVGIGQRHRDGRQERRVFQVGPVHLPDLHEVGQAERAGQGIHVGGVCQQIFDQQLAQASRHGAGDL